MVGVAVETTAAVSAFLSENPVISDETQAREAKTFLDRGRLCIADIETERSGLVKPLNDRVTQINSRYRGPKELLQKVVDELRSRLDRYIRAEEERRIARAEQARLDAERAGIAARDAERIEQDALGNAATGVLDIDVSRLVSDANQAFEDYKKAERQAALAERETHVKIGGGFRRALGLREREVPFISNIFEAIKALGYTKAIEEGVLKSARAYKKQTGKWPPGITVTTERKI
jgi:hypothetical protein